LEEEEGNIMLKNYFKIALRNLQRHQAYSLLNISGLTIGMACSILILVTNSGWNAQICNTSWPFLVTFWGLLVLFCQNKTRDDHFVLQVDQPLTRNEHFLTRFWGVKQW